ncbi:MAG: type II toxin-antitoxin system VapC family toxin [Candidatus Lokiarchaeota archaeon]|nr:type II toxin-antitoxin system VapC family toxin [Candidatus Lokiarchaeota archaeon]
MCLDTRLLSQYLNKKEKVKNVIEGFQQQDFDIYTTTILISEFFMGLYNVREPSTTELEKLKDFFLTLHPFGVDYDVSLLAGRLFARLSKGNAIGWRDTFIAAIVLQHGNIIVTSDPEHFNRVTGLNVVEYP